MACTNDFSNKNKYLEPSLPYMPNTDKIEVRRGVNIVHYLMCSLREE